MDQYHSANHEHEHTVRSGLQLAMQHYFPLFAVNNFRWVVYPFGINNPSNLAAEKQLIDLRNATSFKTRPDEFWLFLSKS